VRKEKSAAGICCAQRARCCARRSAVRESARTRSRRYAGAWRAWRALRHLSARRAERHARYATRFADSRRCRRRHVHAPRRHYARAIDIDSMPSADAWPSIFCAAATSAAIAAVPLPQRRLAADARYAATPYAEAISAFRLPGLMPFERRRC